MTGDAVAAVELLAPLHRRRGAGAAAGEQRATRGRRGAARASCLVTRPVDDRGDPGEQDDHEEDVLPSSGADGEEVQAALRRRILLPDVARCAEDGDDATCAATTTRALQRPAAPTATASCGMPQRALAGLHAASEVPMPARNDANQMFRRRGSRTTAGTESRRRLIATGESTVRVTTSVSTLTACQ